MDILAVAQGARMWRCGAWHFLAGEGAGEGLLKRRRRHMHDSRPHPLQLSSSSRLGEGKTSYPELCMFNYTLISIHLNPQVLFAISDRKSVV